MSSILFRIPATFIAYLSKQPPQQQSTTLTVAAAPCLDAGRPPPLYTSSSNRYQKHTHTQTLAAFSERSTAIVLEKEKRRRQEREVEGTITWKEKSLRDVEKGGGAAMEVAVHRSRSYPRRNPHCHRALATFSDANAVIRTHTHTRRTVLHLSHPTVSLSQPQLQIIFRKAAERRPRHQYTHTLMSTNTEREKKNTAWDSDPL